MSLEQNKIHLGDCLDLMRQIPDKSIDLVFTDPPYNMGVRGEKWDKIKGYEDWLMSVFATRAEAEARADKLIASVEGK